MSGWLTCCPLLLIDYSEYIYFWLLNFSNTHINENHVYRNVMILLCYEHAENLNMYSVPDSFSHRARHTLIDWFCKAAEERKKN